MSNQKSNTPDFTRAISWGCGVYLGILVASILVIVIPVVLMGGCVTCVGIGAALTPSDLEPYEPPPKATVDPEPEEEPLPLTVVKPMTFIDPNIRTWTIHKTGKTFEAEYMGKSIDPWGRRMVTLRRTDSGETETMLVGRLIVEDGRWIRERGTK